MVSRPGDTFSSFFFLTRTIGRALDVKSFSSSLVISEYFFAVLRSFTIIANAFCGRLYHMRKREISSKLQHRCIPPHDLITLILPWSSFSVKRLIALLLPKSFLFLSYK